MRHGAKLIVKYLYLGVSIGCILFVISCLVGVQTGGTAFSQPLMKELSRQAMGYIITGIACSAAAIVYHFGRLALEIKILIHFAVGMGTFCFVSLFLGWFSFRSGQLFYTMLTIFMFCGGFVILWICFYLYNCNDAKKINHRLKEMEPEGAEGKG